MNRINLLPLELLEGENYHTWKIQMQQVLVQQNLWGYVSGSIPKPPVIRDESGAITNKNEIKQWKIKDQRAFAKIIFTVSPTELKHIQDSRNSKHAWDNLNAIYESMPPPPPKCGLIMQLTNLNLDSSANMREHIKKFSVITSQLAEMNESLPEHILIVLFLNTLPMTYQEFYNRIVEMRVYPSLGEVQALAIEEEAALQNLMKNTAGVTGDSGTPEDSNEKKEDKGGEEKETKEVGEDTEDKEDKQADKKNTDDQSDKKNTDDQADKKDTDDQADKKDTGDQADEKHTDDQADKKDTDDQADKKDEEDKEDEK